MNNGKPRRLTIGVLSGWQAYARTLNTFLEQVFRGIQMAAREQECNLLLGCGLGPPRHVDFGRPAWPAFLPEADFVPVGPWNTDGLIVVTPVASQAGMRYFQSLVAQGHPIVFAACNEPLPSVDIDNEGGIDQAVAHLAEHGHTRIAFIAGHEHSVSGGGGRRLRGYSLAMGKRGLLVDPRLIAHGFHTQAGGLRAMRMILDTGAPFTAVLASNDESAVGAIEALQEAGLRVPHDVAVIGFDDRLEARALIPPLTTIRYPTVELGYQAATLLLGYIRGTESRLKALSVPTRLIIRQSCGCLPGTMNDIGSIHLHTEGIRSVRNRERAKEIRFRVAQKIAQAVVADAGLLSLEETLNRCQDLVDAFVGGIERNEPVLFDRALQRLLYWVSSSEGDPQVWETAISLLRSEISLLLAAPEDTALSKQADDMLHRARVAISETASSYYARRLLYQSDMAEREGEMVAQFFGGQNEEGIFAALVENLSEMGITYAAVATYEAKEDDPVAWSILRALSGRDERQRRFLTRQFPLPGVYPEGSAYQLVVLPLLIREELYGFVAFDAANLAPCAEIVRQLAAALREAWLYREAVEGWHLAEEADRLKSRFLSVVGHELRTPLNLIAGLSDMLLREGKEIEPGKFAVNREDVERVYVSAQHLDELVQDVLDLMRSDLGQLKLVCEPLDLAEVLGAVSMIGQTMAQAKGLAWRAEIPSSLPRVWGDRMRLRQITLNLVSNAVKYTPQGEVALILTAHDDLVQVSVRDTGLGIPLEEQELIFEEFQQSDRTVARGYGGLGLGLAICKRLVEMHGGEIHAYSSGEEGAGSTFSFSLPAIDVSPAPDLLGMPHDGVRRVLLLIKDATGGSLVRSRLEQQGFQVEMRQVGETDDWLSSVFSAPPHVVALDLGLAAEQGWQILRVLKESHIARNIPVLFYSLADDRGTGAMLQMDYLDKPVGTAELAEALADHGLLSTHGGDERAKKILIVDDEPAILDMHARIVEAHMANCVALRAGGGKEALQIIRREQPDLVLLDLIMPEMDGFVVLEAMREDEPSRGIPVIVLTGHTLTEDDMARLNRGVASVLGKGLFTVDETLDSIADALASKRRFGSDTRWAVRRAMAYIHTHYAESISLGAVASYVGLSERHLTRCFRDELGVTPITYLNRYRVRHAKMLLEGEDKGITEIATEVGFSDPTYFARVFRREVGVSPSAYQRGTR